MTTFVKYFTIEYFVLFAHVPLLFMEVLYLIFALILARQISLMNRSFKTEFSGLFSAIGKFHILGTLLVILLTVFGL